MDYLNNLFNTALKTLMPQEQNPRIAVVRAKYTPSQLLAINKLNRLVADVQTYNESKLPTKPTRQHIVAILQESERALGPLDPQIQNAVVKLSSIFVRQEDWANAEPNLRRLLRIHECISGRRSKGVLSAYEALIQMYEHTRKTADILRVYWLAANVHSHLSPEEHPNRLKVENVLASGYLAVKELNAAEDLSWRLLAVSERAYGMEQPPTRAAVSRLVTVFSHQCYEAVQESSEGGLYRALRYVLDVISLSEKMAGERDRALWVLGRMCLWTNHERDATIAFVLAAAETYDDTGEESCSTDEERGPTCGSCQKEIKIGSERYICRNCFDVDVCGECYREKSEKKSAMDRFPKTCRTHAFFEVPREEETEGTIETWTQDLHCRITTEIEQLIENSRQRKLTMDLAQEYLYDGTSVEHFLQTTSSHRLPAVSESLGAPLHLELSGFYLDKIHKVFPIDSENPYAYATKLWHLDRVFMSPQTYSHHWLPNVPMTDILRRRTHDSISQWAIGSSAGALPSPFYFDPFVVLEYSNIMLETFTGTLLQLLNERFRSQAETPSTLRDVASSRNVSLSEQFGRALNLNARDLSILAGVESRLLQLFEYLPSRAGTDPLGASLFNFENLVEHIEHLRVPAKAVKHGEPMSNALRNMLENLAPLPTSWNTSVTRKQTYEDLPNLQYDELQFWLTDCEYSEELALRVRVVLRAAIEIRKLGTVVRSSLVSGGHVRPLSVLQQAIRYWRKQAIPEWASRDSPMTQEHMANAFAVRIIDLQTQLSTLFGLRTSEGLPVSAIDPQSFNSLSFEDQRKHLYRRLESLEKHLEHNKCSPAAGSSKPEFCSSRTFFVTARGFVGLAAQDTNSIEVGDAVLLLDNAVLPVVARKRGGEYAMMEFATIRELVGEEWRDLEDLHRLGRRTFNFS